MKRAVSLSALLCAAVAAGTCGASAAADLLVVAGGRCPGGNPVPAEEALGMASAGCILLAPAVRARIGIPGSATVPARVCGARAAEIAGLDAVICRQPQAGGHGPRAHPADGAEPIPSSPGDATAPHRAGRPFPLPLLFTPALSLAGCLMVLRAVRTALRGNWQSRTMPTFLELCLMVSIIVVFGAVGMFSWLDFLGVIDVQGHVIRFLSDSRAML